MALALSAIHRSAHSFVSSRVLALALLRSRASDVRSIQLSSALVLAISAIERVRSVDRACRLDTRVRIRKHSKQRDFIQLTALLLHCSALAGATSRLDGNANGDSDTDTAQASEILNDC